MATRYMAEAGAMVSACVKKAQKAWRTEAEAIKKYCGIIILTPNYQTWRI